MIVFFGSEASSDETRSWPAYHLCTVVFLVAQSTRKAVAPTTFNLLESLPH
jgi:hypothetical protein